MDYFWTITLQTANRTGVETITKTGVYTARPGTTRQDAYRTIRAALAESEPALGGAAVLHWSIDPNQL